MRRYALLALALACRAPEGVGEAPVEAAATYVEPTLCAGCHPEEAARWRGSHHDRAMELPSPAAVRGRFDGTVHDGARFRRDGDAYVIDTGGASHRVRYTFGVEPLQQYLVEQPGGRLQAFPIAWDTAGERWFRAQAADLPWTGRDLTWNTMCAECHSTGVAKQYDPATDRFATTLADIDVGCQACHGPGSRHAADPKQRLPARGDAEACAPCHARRTRIAADTAPGDSVFDRFRPATLAGGLYFPDGQIRDEVFEYGSFAQSAMHERGVRCIDCHDPHSAAAQPADATCLRCHGVTPPPPQFPGLAARAQHLATPAHHHHPVDSPGARCVACHMPARTYLGVDARRDHSFRVPRPDLAAALGTPDACTQTCHAGRDARWAAATVATWFPGPKPAHYGEALHRAQTGAGSAAELAQLTADRGLPAIVRATALELLFGDPRACVATAAAGLRDPSPLVRSVAVACGEHLAPAERAAFAAPALDDPVRLVRIEAARVLAGPAAAALPAAHRPALARARAELDEAYRGDLDRAEGWFNLALLAEVEGRRDDAIAHYRRALALSPGYLPAEANLRALLAR